MERNRALFEGKERGAYFSKCRQYRYRLWRIWNDTLPLVMFIGLNPSTANETEDDATIRRVMRFARDWGYGGCVMVNLFPYVSTDPAKLIECGKEELYRNRWCLFFVAQQCEEIIFAWGNFNAAIEGGNEVAKMFPHGKCLKKNKNGSPIHPLYVAANTVPVKYSM